MSFWSIFSKTHRRLVFGRRTREIAAALASMLPDKGKVLDIGCGDGTIAALVSDLRPRLEIQGIEVKARPTCAIPCTEFDGSTIPFGDGSFDICMFVDVLHHTDDPFGLLSEAKRVCSRGVLIKDHLSENAFDYNILKFMDWVGNRPHGVVLPYNYMGRKEWEEAFGSAGLVVQNWTGKLSLYPQPADMLFGRGLHFVAYLENKP